METLGFAAQVTAAKLVTVKVGRFIFIFIQALCETCLDWLLLFYLVSRSTKWISPMCLLRNVLKSAKITRKGEFAEQEAASEKGHLVLREVFHCFSDLLLNICILPLSPCPDTNECVTNGA